MLRKLMALLRGHKGQTMVEYALIIVLISVAAIVALTAMGGSIEAVFNDIVTRLSPAAG